MTTRFLLLEEVVSDAELTKLTGKNRYVEPSDFPSLAMGSYTLVKLFIDGEVVYPEPQATKPDRP